MGCEPHIIDNVLMIIQILLFLLGRILDDMSWHDIGVNNEVMIFQSIALGCMILCIIIQVIRKWEVEGMLKILFFRSQLKFLISWALIITNAVLFFNIFGCHHEIQQSQIAFFFMVYKECCINVTQLFLTNLNFSLICNTKAVLLEFAVYQLVIFGEIIYNGTLMIMYIRNLEGVEKDLSILFISLLIANQILIMDLIFRAAYQDRQRQEEKENKLIHHIISAHHFLEAESPHIQTKAQINAQSQPSKIKDKPQGIIGSQLLLAIETQQKANEQDGKEIPNKTQKK